jgi:hypothetical protein
MESSEQQAPTTPDPATDPGARSRTGLPPRAFTDYHAKYFVHELSRRCPSDSIDRLAGVVAGAQVVRFSHTEHEGIISILEPFPGKSGWLKLSRFTVESLDQLEDHLILGAMADDGTPLDEACAARLFTLPGAPSLAPIKGRLNQDLGVTQVVTIRWKLA